MYPGSVLDPEVYTPSTTYGENHLIGAAQHRNALDLIASGLTTHEYTRFEAAIPRPARADS